jgi:hypothetical protein
VVDDEEIYAGGNGFAEWFQTCVHGCADLRYVAVVGDLEAVLGAREVGHFEAFGSVVAECNYVGEIGHHLI